MRKCNCYSYYYVFYHRITQMCLSSRKQETPYYIEHNIIFRVDYDALLMVSLGHTDI